MGNRLQWIHHICVVAMVFYFVEISDPQHDELGRIGPGWWIFGTAFIYQNIQEPFIFSMRYLNFSRAFLLKVKTITIINTILVYVSIYIGQIWMICDYVMMGDYVSCMFTVIVSILLDLIDLKIIYFHWSFDVDRAIADRQMLAELVNVRVKTTTDNAEVNTTTE